MSTEEIDAYVAAGADTITELVGGGSALVLGRLAKFLQFVDDLASLRDDPPRASETFARLDEFFEPSTTFSRAQKILYARRMADHVERAILPLLNRSDGFWKATCDAAPWLVDEQPDDRSVAAGRLVVLAAVGEALSNVREFGWPSLEAAHALLERIVHRCFSSSAIRKLPQADVDALLASDITPEIVAEWLDEDMVEVATVSARISAFAGLFGDTEKVNRRVSEKGESWKTACSGGVADCYRKLLRDPT